MRLELELLRLVRVRLELGTPDPDNGTDPGDAVTVPLGFAPPGVWERPSIPALELDE